MESTHSPYLKHIFVCVNKREDNSACCADRSGEEIKEKLKAYVKTNGLKGKVRISGAGCLDLCSKGANVMVEPDHALYSHVKLEDVDRIIAEQLAPLAGKEPGAKTQPVEAFLFDLGNVLVRFDHMIVARKVAPPEADPELLYQLFWDSPLVRLHDEGKISSREFYDEMRHLAGLRIGYEEFIEVWNGIFAEIEPMTGLVERLLEKGYRCVLASNTNRAHFDWLVGNYPFLRKLTGWALSYEIGYMKPHPAFYKRALELVKAPAARVFYIDDRKDLIAAAGALGLQTHQFTGDYDALVEKLKNVGVKL